MICKNCGANLADGMKFCTKCGSKVMEEPVVNTAPQQNFVPQQNFAPQQPMAFGGEAVAPAPKKKSASKVIIPVVAVILVVALAVGAYFLFSKPYKGALDDYFKAVETEDVDKFKETLPDFMGDIVKLYASLGGDEAVDQAYEELAKSQHAYFASWVDDADDIKISYKVVSAEEESKEDLEDELDDLKTLGLDIEVEEAYELELEVTVKGDGKEETEEIKAYAYKEKKGWSVIVEAGSGSIL